MTLNDNISTKTPRSAALHGAKTAKKDEFYTQYDDIQKEINAYLEFNPNVFRDKTILLPCDDPEWSNFTKFFAANFQRFGLKKLISTSYANSKKGSVLIQLSLFEEENPNFDVTKTETHGKIFVLDRDSDNSGCIDINDLQWNYLQGDGDFRSPEVVKLRDEADIIITNPPFSLIREFLEWILIAHKKFLIIGSLKAITNKDFFPHFMNNEIWLGPSISSGDREFRVPNDYSLDASSFRVDDEGNKYIRVKGVRWYTNLDHGRRHQTMQLMSMEDNRKYSRHREVREIGYPKYDNYDAIDVTNVDSIPCDYKGIMGVPVSFFDKYNPDQFEILGCTQRGCHDKVPDTKKYYDYVEVKPDGTKTGYKGTKTNENANLEKNDGKHNYFINNSGHVVQSLDSRIFIKLKEV